MGTNPVRCARFIVRKNWIIAGTDDMKLRVYNYNTMEKVKEWDAHTDYIRFIEIHPNRPYILRYVLRACFIVACCLLRKHFVSGDCRAVHTDLSR